MMFLILLAACSKDKGEAGNQAGSEKNSDTNQQDLIYPLTGLAADEAEETKQRPIAVMVNNHPKARPQSGLSQADLVFEILAEGNITRFLAIYQSNLPDVVGPVRSAREYYFNLADAYDAIYVYHGAANFIEDMIQTKGVENINGATYDNDGRVFKRESFREAPHNSYLQLQEVNGVAEEKGYETTATTPALNFSDEDISGEPAELVTIAYSSSRTVQYDYNEESESYYRSSDGEQSVELNTDEPIEVDNVFIIETVHEVIDDEGRRQVDLQAGGQAYLMQKGVVRQVEWAMTDHGIVPVEDGKELDLTPGQTWVNVIPTSPGLEETVTISGH